MDDLTKRLTKALKEEHLLAVSERRTGEKSPMVQHVRILPECDVCALIREAESHGDGWIKVTERLPESVAWVLVNNDVVAYYDSYLKHWMSRSGQKIKRVTHWRPLPTPPGGQ